MKKLKWFLAILLVAIISTGCVKFNATMEIKNDKSMDFSIIYAFDKSVMGEMASLKEEDFKELKEEGYSVEKYKDGNFEGFKMTLKVKNIDEVSTDQDVVFNLSGMMQEKNNYMFKVVKDGDKSVYYAKFKFDSNDSGLNDNDDEILPDENENILISPNETDDDSSLDLTGGNDDLDLSGMMGSMDLSFNVKLPSSAISSNATTKEDGGKKLSWKLGSSGSQTLEFAFEIDPNAKSDSNLLLYIGIGAGVLVLVIAIVAIIAVSKKKNKVAPAPVQEAVAPENKE